MNAERLHRLAADIQADLVETDVLGRLDRLASALQSQVQNPQEPSYQQQVSTLRQELQSALTTAPSNAFSPLWVQLAKELGFGGLLGSELAEAIESIFRANEITPSIAASEVSALAERIREVAGALDPLLLGLRGLGVAREDLGIGEVEIGVVIPRREVSNELRPLGKELLELDRIFLPFTELATGSRPDFEVRAISSSDFSVFLDSAQGTGLVIAIAVERIVRTYDAILGIRLKRKELKDMDVPEEVLAPLADHATAVMGETIDDVAKELVDEFGKGLNVERQNELRTEIAKSLRKIADRIDRGFNIDVRTGAAEAHEDGSPTETSAEIVRIEKLRPGMGFINTTGEPILHLPAETNGDGDTDDDETDDGEDSEAKATT